MTKVPGAPDSGDVRPGMAFYAGSGPPGTCCGTCKHRGYYDRDYEKRTGCALFFKWTGKSGPPVGLRWASCKYYEALNVDP
jgi:hypothetical protein